MDTSRYQDVGYGHRTAIAGHDAGARHLKGAGSTSTSCFSYRRIQPLLVLCTSLYQTRIL